MNMTKTLAALFTALIALSGLKASAQTPVVDATDAAVGYWGTTHASCLSYYGTHKPWYAVSAEVIHSRDTFVVKSSIRDQICRIEGDYTIKNADLSYEIKKQECEIVGLSDELKASVENGQMLISLGSEIADTVCPVRGGILRLHLIRR